MATSPNAPRLVYIVTSAQSADVLLRGHLRALVLAGFDVTVITSPDFDLDEIVRRERVEIIPVHLEREMSPLKDLRALFSIYKALRKIRPHIVNASTPKAGLLGMIASWFAGVPVRIYQLRGLRLETTRGWRRRILLAAEWLAARSAHTVVCNGPSLRAAFLELNLVPPVKVIVLGAGSSNGVDTKRFSPSVPGDLETGRLRLGLGIAEDEIVIGYVGRLTRDKGVCDLVTAFDQVLASFSQARLLLVGMFEDGDPLPHDIRQRLELDERVVVTGFVGDTAPYYHLMDLLVFPSYREGLPNAPLEAAASALPVVGYRATGTVDAVVDGETGILVEIADTEALASAICRLLRDPILRDDMSLAGRQRVENLFESAKVWQQWREFYRERLANGVPAFR